MQNLQGAMRLANNAVYVKKSTDADIKNISEDEEYNISDISEEKEDPINTTLAYCVKAELEEISGDDFNYQEDESDESEDITEQSKKPKPRKYHTRQSSSRKISDNKFWGSLNKRAKVKKPKRFNCTQNCKQNCKTKIDKQWRQDLCTEYWNLNAVERKNYILQFVESRPVLRLRIIRTNRSTKGHTNRYFLKNRSNEKVRVCLGFFLSTLSISGYLVKSAMEDSSVNEDNEKLEYTQIENVKKDNKNESDSNIEKRDEIINQRNSSQDNRVTNTEIQNTLNAPTATVAEDSALPQQPCSQKSSSSLPKSSKTKREYLPKPVKCDGVCKMKCSLHFSQQQREQMCATYWSMDYKRRKDFLLSHIETRNVVTTKNDIYRKSNSRKRKISNRFYFRGNRGENVRVCSNFFMSTLCTGWRTIDNAIKNADPNTGSYIGEDKRGKKTPGNKIPEDMVLGVKHHIDSYPTWAPHKKYKTRFLHSSLNIEKMYREYKQTCIDQQRKFVNSAYFRLVFHKDYRLAFLKPKTEHATKASSKKKNKDGDALTFKTLNPNISDFTGVEGGFWIPAEPNVAAVPQIANQQQPQQSLEYSQIHATTYDVNRLNIQQNLQLLAPECVEQTPFLNVINATQYSVSTNYLQQQSEKQEPQQNNSQDVLSSYASAAYAQDPSVFRIL